jgi:hypothetical protein
MPKRSRIVGATSSNVVLFTDASFLNVMHQEHRVMLLMIPRHQIVRNTPIEHRSASHHASAITVLQLKKYVPKLDVGNFIQLFTLQGPLRNSPSF